MIAERHRLVEAEAINLLTLAMLANVEGRFAESEAHYTEVRDRLRYHGSPFGDFVYVVGLTSVRLGQDRPSAAEPLLRTLLPGSVPVAELALGVVLARQGEREQAYRLGRRSPTVVPVVPDHLYGIACPLGPNSPSCWAT